MLIPIGHSCHAAGNLNKLGLRKESFPFDWLLIPGPKVFEYINDLINTRFQNFTKDLTYNHRQKVVSLHYDYVEFFHHDLIKNKTLNRPEDNEKDLVELMNNRGKRFINIIENKENEVVFLCMLKYKHIFIKGENNNTLYEDMLKFDNNTNINCHYKVLLYFFNDEDYEMKLPPEFENLKHFIFEIYMVVKKTLKLC